MNVWTFLDRNSVGLFILFLISMCFGFGTCGDDKGCRIRIGTNVAETVPPSADAGIQ